MDLGIIFSTLAFIASLVGVIYSLRLRKLHDAIIKDFRYILKQNEIVEEQLRVCVVALQIYAQITPNQDVELSGDFAREALERCRRLIH